MPPATACATQALLMQGGRRAGQACARPTRETPTLGRAPEQPIRAPQRSLSSSQKRCAVTPMPLLWQTVCLEVRKNRRRARALLLTCPCNQVQTVPTLVHSDLAHGGLPSGCLRTPKEGGLPGEDVEMYTGCDTVSPRI